MNEHSCVVNDTSPGFEKRARHRLGVDPTLDVREMTD